MSSADAFELKAQALNNDPRISSAGISALKFTGDKKYVADGNFSHDLPPPTAPAPDSPKPKSDSVLGKRLRVLIRMVSEDAFELKTQALNDDDLLKQANIAALKFVSDKKYIIGGDFSPELPPPNAPKPDSPSPKPDSVMGKRLRIVLRAASNDIYDLVAKHLNNDPALVNAGISGIELAKGAGMVAAPKETPKQPAPASVPPPAPAPAKKKRSFRGCLVGALIVGIIGIVGVGALLLLPGLLAPPPAPTATTAAVVAPVVDKPTLTKAPAVATASRVPTATATETESPTPQPIFSCQAPEQGTITAENLSCRYGPGASYLYRTGLAKGDEVQIIGRSDSAYGTWVYVQTPDNIKCWINSNSKYVEFQGDAACLDSYYPDRAPLILFNTDLFPAPANVEASRSGNYVSISWIGYELAPGDRESENSPRYLVEVWTCQGGEIVFFPIGTSDQFVDVPDETGCAEASHGQVYLAHKDGYIGPTYIPWP